MTINASTKSPVERLCDFKIYATSVLSFIGSVCDPDKAPRGHIYVMVGPVIASEGPSGPYGARRHSNNTAEMIAMTEALALFGPRGPVTDEQSL